MAEKSNSVIVAITSVSDVCILFDLTDKKIKWYENYFAYREYFLQIFVCGYRGQMLKQLVERTQTWWPEANSKTFATSSK